MGTRQFAQIDLPILQRFTISFQSSYLQFPVFRTPRSEMVISNLDVVCLSPGIESSCKSSSRCSQGFLAEAITTFWTITPQCPTCLSLSHVVPSWAPQETALDSSTSCLAFAKEQVVLLKVPRKIGSARSWTTDLIGFEESSIRG